MATSGSDLVSGIDQDSSISYGSALHLLEKLGDSIFRHWELLDGWLDAVMTCKVKHIDVLLWRCNETADEIVTLPEYAFSSLSSQSISMFFHMQYIMYHILRETYGSSIVGPGALSGMILARLATTPLTKNL
jgi:hypothetical protein